MSGQRSAEWFAQRAGKFTSSRISELMGIKGLNDLGRTYAFDMAVELFEGRNLDEDFVSFDMQRGIDLEPLAFECFKELKKLDFLKVTESDFIKLNEDTGGSPDGHVSDNSGLEIKCPKPNKFFKLVCNNEIDAKYLDQMQHQMMCSNTIQTYFFNYIIYNGKPMYHEIIVLRNEERIELIKARIKEAVIIRDEYISQLESKQQWNVYEIEQA